MRDPSKWTALGLEEAIGIPIEDWVCDCFGTCLAVIDRGLVDGRLCYGWYLGPVHPESPFHGQPDQPQGFIRLADGRIFDPTRWTFMWEVPYIYVGPDTDYREDADPWVTSYVNELRHALASGERKPYRGRSIDWPRELQDDLRVHLDTIGFVP